MTKPPTVIDFGKERAARRKAAQSAMDNMLDKLRALPIAERTEVIIALFAMISGEFARMVLDFAKPGTEAAATETTKKRARKMRKRADAILDEVRTRLTDEEKPKDA
jgi:hypothetical protein